MSNTKILPSDLISLAQEAGCVITVQKSFTKIQSPTANRKAIYVANSKKTVTKVDFSGFDVPDMEAFRRLSPEEAKELNLGAVRGQMVVKDLKDHVTDEVILQEFRDGLNLLLDEVEGFKLAPKAPKAS